MKGGWCLVLALALLTLVPSPAGATTCCGNMLVLVTVLHKIGPVGEHDDYATYEMRVLETECGPHVQDLGGPWDPVPEGAVSLGVKDAACAGPIAGEVLRADVGEFPTLAGAVCILRRCGVREGSDGTQDCLYRWDFVSCDRAKGARIRG